MHKNLDLTEDNWNKANRAGMFYKVKNVEVGVPKPYYHDHEGLPTTETSTRSTPSPDTSTTTTFE